MFIIENVFAFHCNTPHILTLPDCEFLAGREEGLADEVNESL